MKITIKFANKITTYPDVESAEKFLNEALYYCEKLILLYSFEDEVEYNNDTNLEYLQKQANIYDEGWITAIQTWDELEN